MTGSEQSQGPGWWQASDGLWYPPADSVPAAMPDPPDFVPSSGESGFFKRLFDTSFRTFVTPSILKVLFWIGVTVISLGSLILLIVMLASGEGAAVVVGLVLAPLYWFFGIIYMRVIVEVITVFFRIEENTRKE